MSMRTSPIPAEVQAWLTQQPPEAQAALRAAWHRAEEACPPAPQPSPTRIASVWSTLEAAIETGTSASQPACAEETEALWHLAAEAEPETPAPDADRIAALWERLEAAAAPPDRPTAAPRAGTAPSRPAQPPPRARRRPLWALVAVAAVGFGLFGWWLLQPHVLTAPHGQSLVAMLPDGSSIELNSGSTLTYRRGFGRFHRHSRLDGEAFFDVQPDAEPFVVTTFNAEVAVLGTRFNVRAWPDARQPETDVAVEQGRVAVAGRGETRATPIVLERGEFSRVREGQAPSAPAASSDLQPMAWRSGSFVFYDASLDRIFREIERRFAVTIDAPEAVRSRTWSFAQHQPRSAAALLDDLCTSAGLTVRQTPDGFTVTP